MIITLFRPKRVKNGKQHVSRSYRGRYRLDGGDKIVDVALNTNDKRVAQQRLEQIVREKQQELAGIIPQKSLRVASQTTLAEHLDAYAADLNTIRRDERYVSELKNRVKRLMRECNWSQLKDITSDSFLKWRSDMKTAPKTLNEYLASMSSFMNWLKKHKRIESNPLECVEKIESNGEQTRPRRAFSNDEFMRFLTVAKPRRAVYLTAVFTGLRRSELAELNWDDVHLDMEKPYLNVRASTTKNHKQVIIGLHPDVVNELRQLHEKAGKPASGPVFLHLPLMRTFRKDLKRAGIDFIDGKGKRVDFHSLRHTLATNMALAGTAPRVAMEIMRHSDMRLTSKTYTDAGLLPVVDAVTKLPSFTGSLDQYSQIDSQSLFRDGQKLSTTVNESKKTSAVQVADAKELSHSLTGAVTTGPDMRKEWAEQDSNLH